MKNAREAQRVKVKGVATKADDMHIKVKGTDTKETKAINTKVLSSMVTRVIKAVSDKEAKEAKELDTKVVIKELDTKEASRGHGLVASNGSPEMTVGEAAKAKVAEVKNTGRSPPQRGTGGRLKWTSMQKSAHVRTVPKTRVGHGTIRHGKIRKIRQGATTANMTRSTKRLQDTNAKLEAATLEPQITNVHPKISTSGVRLRSWNFLWLMAWSRRRSYATLASVVLRLISTPFLLARRRIYGSQSADESGERFPYWF